MHPFAPREARRLGPPPLAAALLLAFGLQACAGDPHARAAAADLASGSHLFGWLADHDPSAVVVLGGDADAMRSVSAVAPDARVLPASADVAAACATARRAHALLVALTPPPAEPLRSRLQGCGFAIARDAGSLVIAPQ